MKACPNCGRLYPADAGFCPVDGSGLTSATQVPVAPDDKDPRVGQLLNERYEIRRIVADGGMGRVYEALDLVDRRNVAVKILHGEVARDPVQVERFKREFEVSNLLPHDHIVEVMAFSELKDGSYALVMEFLFGEELSQALGREKFLSPPRIVRMVSQVAIGLDKAHEKKLVHRDLKPDNVFLCQTPEGDIIKLLDFGSVKDKTAGAKKLTVMGTTIGSPFYMAPEQAQGLDTLDHRADVWALGAILFECMTGHVPFPGVNGPQILLNILTKEPARASQSPGLKYPVPPTMDAVFAKAFKKMASLRQASVGDLADMVGQAYGLTGSHKEWANIPEAALQEQIASRMDSIMAAPRDVLKKDAVDDFFGEGDALAEAGGGVAPEPVAQKPAGRRGAGRSRRAESSREDSMAQAMRGADAALKEQEEEMDLALPGVKTDGIPAWVWIAAVVLLGALGYLLLS